MESCDQLSGFINKLDQLMKDPDNYIYEVFSDLRRNVDLKYEEYKLKLDEETQKIRDELDRRLQSHCVSSLDFVTFSSMNRSILARFSSIHTYAVFSFQCKNEVLFLNVTHVPTYMH